jgi:hypothetical protein
MITTIMNAMSGKLWPGFLPCPYRFILAASDGIE